MQNNDTDLALRRQQLRVLGLNVTRWAMAGELNGADALAVVEAIRAVRDALPEAPVETEEASDAAA
ncbi:hypothetical protein A3862_04165 [Methylobacterium sp. XJLW]|uniref:hypothetical protein n=1 Tax=Methylobacterium sp. XJLW TaxID=739141 RepID=UPI000DAAF943|nr:hypothetical protein [Methylobacterium sp. XJLW]AWV14794.1 hypothetical protein A3862_04165 [Methylobacterium sp. XJLW]